MDPAERKAWTGLITPEDLDKHMADTEQAQANANIIKQMFHDYPLAKGSKLLVPGCGTCQLFDYIRPSDLGNIELILTDINSSYLEKTKERLGRFAVKYQTALDDIEKTSLKGNYAAALIVMVLQHVEWKKAMESVSKLEIPRFYIIEQEQDFSLPAVTKGRKLTPSLKEYAEIGNPQLIPREKLIGYMKDKNYSLNKIYERDVPDNKKMVGFVFEK